MRAIGIVRKIDPLGRVNVPKEMRRVLGIEDWDQLDIYTDDQGRIILEQFKMQCVFCGNNDEDRLIIHRDVHVCPLCLAELKAR